MKLLIGLGMGFTTTIYVPFLLSRGLTYADVALVNIGFWLIIIFAEVPTGLLADSRSRAWSVRTGLLLSSIGMLSYSFASGVVSAILCEVIVGLANAFISGADEAWITDALKKHGEEHRLKAVIANATIAATGGLLVGGVLGAPLGSIDLRIGWWLASASVAAAMVIARCFMSNHGEPAVRVTETEALRLSVHLLRTSSTLRWLLATQLLFAFVLPFNHYWAPFMKMRVDQAALGYVWLAIFGGLMIGNWTVRRFSIFPRREEYGIIAAIMITAFGLLAAPYAAGIAGPVLCFAIHEFGRGLVAPLCVIYTQHRVGSSYRATYTSLQSLLSKTSYALVLSLVWLYTKERASNEETIRHVWTVCAVALLAGASVLRWRLPRP